MNYEKQVESEHYFNGNYVHKARWLTYFYQINILQKYNVQHALEIGPGHGWVKNIASDLGIKIETVDIDPELKPDYVASVEALPLSDDTYDAVCAFEVLEHLPFGTFVKNLQEMARVSKRYVVISVPDHRKTLFHMRIKLPLVRYKEFFRKVQTNTEHSFDGQHYWEIGKKGYGVDVVTSAMKDAGLVLRESVVHPDTITNHFFVLEKVSP